MKTAYRLAVGVSFLLLTLSVSYAQPATGHYGFGPWAGGIKLVGGTDDQCVISYMSGLNLHYFFSDYVAGELSGGLGWVRPRDPDSYFKVAGGYRTYIYPFDYKIRIHPFSKSRLNPYFAFGAGVVFWNLRRLAGEDKWFPIPESGESEYGRKFNITLLSQVGAQFYISDRTAFDLGLRYAHWLGQSKDNIGTGDPNSGAVEVRRGLNFSFGGFIDRDKDGIEDKYDADPYQAEDFDGFQDEDGAPDLDNDGDGIPDDRDNAPMDAEDRDGFEDSDGVPDTDNDGDGIPDSLDKCPNQAEDMDGYQDEDGCPDFDNDGDGIPDAKDNCPDQAETVNGYEDEDGCPDEIPMDATLRVQPAQTISFEDSKLILTGVTFATGKAALTENAKRVLDTVYESLVIHSDVRLEIRGYTDDVGSAASNLKLSQSRAESVREYLVTRGIGSNRLKAIGYGEANPISSNKSSEGREKNRRIEFIRLEE